MITFEEAKSKINSFLVKQEERAIRFNSFRYLPDIRIGNREIKGKDEYKIKLAVSHVEENEFCWRFYWSSKIFMDINNEDYALIGNTPIIVDKENGDIYGTRIDFPKNHMEDFKDYKEGRICEYNWIELKQE
jgi:hypothetical protein